MKLFIVVISFLIAGQTIGQTRLVDSGFRPEVHGMGFENYGESKFQNLTAEEVRRIFGDQVCATMTADRCILTPPADQWMKLQNKGMNGGHCYGFSVVSLRFFQKLLEIASFGVERAVDLTIETSEKLQREIAYSFVFQTFDSVQSARITGTPNEILAKLVEALKPSGSLADAESYTIGFFNEKGEGGHAVTPYALEDRGNGQMAVLIYDNNFPKETRGILFDRNANTWTYTASTNPNEPMSVYKGSAATQSLMLFPTRPGLAKQACSFCRGTEIAMGKLGSQSSRFNEVFLEGSPTNHAHLLITDAQGKRYGKLTDGTFVREIESVRHQALLSDELWKTHPEPRYFVPTGMAFDFAIDGSNLTVADATEVFLIGPGYDLGVRGLQMDPGQVDHLNFSADGHEFSYRTEKDETPELVMGYEAEGADYAFSISGMEIKGGGELQIRENREEGSLSFSARNLKQAGQFAVSIHRISEKGDEVFSHHGISLANQDIAYLDYAAWSGDKAPLLLRLDRGGDGSIDESLPLSDEE